MKFSHQLPMKPIAFPFLAVLAGAALAMLTAGCGRSAEHPAAVSAPEHETALEHAKKHLDPSYVCPMHPQVVRSAPGRCPICGMDLVAKEAETSAADRQRTATAEEAPTVTVSDAVVSQLGVRTAEVRRGTLSRHIEGSGVFLRSTARGARPGYQGSDPSGNSAGTSGSALLVLAQVFESEAPLVRQGQTAHVRFPNLGAREWTGTVTSLETQISQTTHTLQFRVSVDNEGASIPGGMSAVVTLEVDPVADVLLIPREAVIVTGKGARVIVALGGGRFQPREVDAEDVGEDEIVIRSGLEEGERVVVSAQFLLDSEANLQAGLQRLSSEHLRAQAAPAGAIQ